MPQAGLGLPPATRHWGPVYPVGSQSPARCQVIFHYAVEHFPARSFHYSDRSLLICFHHVMPYEPWRDSTASYVTSKLFCNLEPWPPLPVILLWPWTLLIGSTWSLLFPMSVAVSSLLVIRHCHCDNNESSSSRVPAIWWTVCELLYACY